MSEVITVSEIGQKKLIEQFPSINNISTTTSVQSCLRQAEIMSQNSWVTSLVLGNIWLWSFMSNIHIISSAFIGGKSFKTVTIQYLLAMSPSLFFGKPSQPEVFSENARWAKPSFLLSKPSQTELLVFQNWAIFDYFELIFLKNTTF